MTKTTRLRLALAVGFLALCGVLYVTDVGAGTTDAAKFDDHGLIAATTTATTISWGGGHSATLTFRSLPASAGRVCVRLRTVTVATAAGTDADYTDQIVLEPGETYEFHLQGVNGFSATAVSTARLNWHVSKWDAF